MIPASRTRVRQGAAIIRNGVPYSNPSTTLSLLPGAAVGSFLARHAEAVRGSLLDLGCGNQPYREWYLPKVDRAVAVDAFISDTLDVTGHADLLPFRDSSFDVVLATEVLEHVADVDASVDEIRRVLVPGGHLLATVPFLYPTHEAPYDFRRFTHFGLNDILVRHGLEVVSLEAKGGPGLLVGHYAALASSALVRRLEGGQGSPAIGSWLRRAVAGTQEVLLGRMHFDGAMTGPAQVVSLGYMVVARRPQQSE